MFDNLLSDFDITDMNFYLKNFGCRLNQYEGDVIAENLAGAGFSRAADFHNADVIIVNGCTVTARADQKVRQFIHKVRRENSSARLILTGCTAEAIVKKFLKKIPGVEILPKRWRYDIAGFLKSSPGTEYTDFPDAGGVEIVRARANLKIQDGCDKRCAYCIVPLVRGNSRCRNADDIVKQVNHLVAAGFKEIVLTGVDIGVWHDSEMRLPGLLKKILAQTDIFRLRLSSIEPPGITDELIGIISSEEKIAPHLHIPLQSGSEDVLSSMMRPAYNPFDVLERVEAIRKMRPELCIGTDIIVGFPTEKDEDFTKTVELLTTGEIAYAHLFPFSPRPGTAAANLKRLDGKIIAERMKNLREIDRRNRENFARKFAGQYFDIVVEQVRGGYVFGHTANFLKVKAKGSANRREVAKILAKSSGTMQIIGEVV
ncbi:tRNA (N(6)-L-threonylcarbamoyladenosine(37)-C(2))-methylthiotransferase MtaB [bacterium]|nr:tRNA (N(6)-L-threonylcarbamoyladenosine(37)-C(2))-methylthiotransferase MtaB [bacterium]